MPRRRGDYDIEPQSEPTQLDLGDNQCPAGEGITTLRAAWISWYVNVTTNAPQERGLRLS